MAVSTVSRRRRSASRAQDAAAKQKRQKIALIVGAVLLVLLLVWRLPGTLKLLKGSSSPRPVAAPLTGTTPSPAAVASSAATHRALAKLLRNAPRDPMAQATTSPLGNTLGTVPVPAGMHDPFVLAGGHASAPPVTTPTTTKTTSASAGLPKQIVIGKPGKGRVAEHGFIVILASIPTAQGQKTATAVAANARRHGVGSVSILNSSNQRPLRGGYWVVYTGPYASAAAGTKASGMVHAHGFSGAYIRQLIVYR